MPAVKRVSVIIPAFNAAATIRACLDALALQTLQPCEVIVVDDASSDQTRAIAQAGAKVVANSRRKGAAGARNTGAFIGRGDILVFTDADCVPPPQWLERITAPFEDPNVGAAGGGYSHGAGEGFWPVFCAEELAFRRRKREGDVQTLVSNNFACRREIFTALGGFPEQYPVSEDMWLSYRISLGHRVVWLKDNGVAHHFKDSLAAYLRHQYAFAAGSARVFVQNPELLKARNHQGRTLHAAVALAFLTAASLLLALILALAGNMSWMRGCLVAAGISLLAHGLLYMPFVSFLSGRHFPSPVLAYGVSWLRDCLCGPSAIHGFWQGFTENRKNK